MSAAIDARVDEWGDSRRWLKIGVADGVSRPIAAETGRFGGSKKGNLNL
jgi:hypothetical protein